MLCFASLKTQPYLLILMNIAFCKFFWEKTFLRLVSLFSAVILIWLLLWSIVENPFLLFCLYSLPWQIVIHINRQLKSLYFMIKMVSRYKVMFYLWILQCGIPCLDLGWCSLSTSLSNWNVSSIVGDGIPEGSAVLRWT